MLTVGQWLAVVTLLERDPRCMPELFAAVEEAYNAAVEAKYQPRDGA